MKFRFEVEKQEELVPFLSRVLSGVPRERIKIQLKQGEVRINGIKTRSAQTLAGGDVVEIFLPEKFSPPKIDIVYEDDFIMAVDKPPFTESEHALPELICAQTGKKVFAAHRLDTNTTGLILLCKTESALAAIIQGFKNGNVKKTYYAQVFGCPENNEGRLTAYLYKHASNSYCTVYKTFREGCKEIITDYKVQTRGSISELVLNPVTGRTHQLRAHMAFVGCPIVGDDKYGNAELNRQEGAKFQRLRSVSVTFGELPAPLDYLNNQTLSVPVGKDIVR